MSKKKEPYTIILDKIGEIEASKVDRESFLRNVFKDEVDKEKLDDIIENGTIVAGVDKDLLSKISRDQIRKEKWDATRLSFLSGLPGGYWAVFGLSADLVQYFVNVFQLTQKILYLYGYGENVFDEDGKISSKSKNVVLLTQAAMFGVSGASKVLINYLGRDASIKAIQKKAGKIALSGTIRKAGQKVLQKFGIEVPATLAEKAAGELGLKSSTKIIVKLPKIIPIVGGFISAGVTYISFSTLGNRVIKILNSGYDKILERASEAVLTDE